MNRLAVVLLAVLAGLGLLGAFTSDPEAEHQEAVTECAGTVQAKGAGQADAEAFCEAAVSRTERTAPTGDPKVLADTPTGPTEPPVTSPTTPRAPKQSDLEDLFASQVESSEWWPTLSDMGFDSTTVVQWGEGVCNRFRQGDSTTEINLEIIVAFPDEERKQEALAFMLGAAIPILCSDFMNELSG